jgi:hypothetical protein
MNEFDHLERQLRTSTRRLGSAGVAARPPRRRRNVRLLAIAGPLFAAAGVAGATGVLDHDGVSKRANVVVRDVVDATGFRSGCARTLPGGRPSRRFSDARPRPELLRILPTLEHAAHDRVPAAELRSAQVIAADGAILRDSLRYARFPDGSRVLLFVTEGGISLQDPSACRAARLEHLAATKGLDSAVRDRAAEVLRTRPDTDPKAQALWTQSDGGASGSPVQPGHPISTRRDFSMSTRGFSGIAHPRAVAVRVVRVRPGTPARVWRGAGAYRATIPVVDGLYAFKGRGGTSGRFRMVQVDRAGEVVRRVVLP